MKKIISLFLALIMLALLCGCSAIRSKDSVTFYYRNAQYQFGTPSGAIGSEKREISGQKNNLTYLNTLYMLGPADEKLELPFPAGTKIKSAYLNEGNVTIELAPGGSMSDSAFTLGCTCLALNNFALTDAATVTIVTEKKSLTIARDSAVLTDSTASNG